MTQISLPTETLVRIPFSGLADFQPLALAPGLPMLDARKLTYQVLLGWFGDLLAEPELAEEGVEFHVQRDGKRQAIVERALATGQDLEGPLQADFEKLKKFLFDVRPVSPSERLIFNRLQPPIGNHDGFLYRVRTEEGVDRLVWCWGFQRKTHYGKGWLCPNPDCLKLSLLDGLRDEACPHCGQALVADDSRTSTSRSRLPIGAISAAAILTALAGGAFWLGSDAPELAGDTIPELAEFGQPGNDTATGNTVSEHAASAETGGTVSEERPESATSTVARMEPAASEPPELLVAVNGLPDIELAEPESASNPESNATALPEVSLPDVASSPDLPAPTEAPATTDTEAGPDDPASLADTALPEPEAPDDDSADGVTLPTVLPEPVVAQAEPAISEPATSESGPASATPAPEETLRTDSTPATRLEIPEPEAETADLDTTSEEASDSARRGSEADGKSPRLSIDVADSGKSFPQDPLQDTVVKDSPEKTLGTLNWHEDYVSAYAEASQQKSFLLMLFRNPAERDQLEAADSPLGDPQLRPILEQFSRVELPVNAAIPATQGDASQDDTIPSLLLQHRSFRHLHSRAGLAIVDLTDPESSNHARVVSVLPLPEEGRFDVNNLELLLTLPHGSISQRTLLFAVRRTVPDSSLSMREFAPTLTQFARRNCRYMAHREQSVPFEQDVRREAVASEFGPQAELRELVFATDTATTIHDAALQAVNEWMAAADSLETLTAPADAMGMELFQSPETGRWYATCLVVRHR